MTVAERIATARQRGIVIEQEGNTVAFHGGADDTAFIRRELEPIRDAIYRHETGVVSPDEELSQPWDPIRSLDDRSLPPFPVHQLPGSIGNWVAAEAEATQTPPELAGMLALAAGSFLISKRIEVEPRPGWREPVNLFIAVLLEPGNRKSAVFADALEPVRKLEAELIEDERAGIAREKSERRQAEGRLRKLEKKAAETGNQEARNEAQVLAEQIDAWPEPVLPRLMVDDATDEKLAMMLAEQGGRIFSASPEGGVFDIMAGLYSKNGAPQFNTYLKGHAGDDLVCDRISREAVRVERPALTCAYAIQPQVIEGLAKNPAFRGRGLLARFEYAAPASPIGDRDVSSAAMPASVRDAYHRVIRRLAQIDGKHVLQLEVAAQERFTGWLQDVEYMLGDGGELEAMRDWGGKLCGATLRIAATLHCTERSPAVPISDGTIGAAIAIARYLIPHAEAVLDRMQGLRINSNADARYVLKWIRRHRRREFTKSEVQQDGRRRFPFADDIDPALEVLEDRKYICQRSTPEPVVGRPSSPTYDVNPAVFEDEQAQKRAGYPKNTSDSGSAVSIQDIQDAFPASENAIPRCDPSPNEDSNAHDADVINVILAQAAAIDTEGASV